MTTLEIADTVTIAVPATGTVYSVDTTRLTSAQITRGFAHGVKQFLTDAAAGKPDIGAKGRAVDAAFARLAEWLAGTPATRSGAIPRADRLFIDEMRAVAKQVGVKLADYDDRAESRDAVREIIAPRLAALLATKGKPSDEAAVSAAWIALQEEANARVAARLAAESIDVSALV